MSQQRYTLIPGLGDGYYYTGNGSLTTSMIASLVSGSSTFTDNLTVRVKGSTRSGNILVVFGCTDINNMLFAGLDLSNSIPKRGCSGGAGPSFIIGSVNGGRPNVDTCLVDSSLEPVTGTYCFQVRLNVDSNNLYVHLYYDGVEKRNTYFTKSFWPNSMVGVGSYNGSVDIYEFGLDVSTDTVPSICGGC